MKRILLTSLFYASICYGNKTAVTIVYDGADQKPSKMEGKLEAVSTDPWTLDLDLRRGDVPSLQQVGKELHGEQYGVLRLMATSEQTGEPYAISDGQGALVPAIFDHAEFKISPEGKIVEVSAILKEQPTAGRNISNENAKVYRYQIDASNPAEPGLYWDQKLNKLMPSARNKRLKHLKNTF